MTNLEKFCEVFPSAESSYVRMIDPCEVKKIDWNICDKYKNCSICREDFWNAPYYEKPLVIKNDVHEL